MSVNLTYLVKLLHDTGKYIPKWKINDDTNWVQYHDEFSINLKKFKAEYPNYTQLEDIIELIHNTAEETVGKTQNLGQRKPKDSQQIKSLKKRLKFIKKDIIHKRYMAKKRWYTVT